MTRHIAGLAGRDNEVAERGTSTPDLLIDRLYGSVNRRFRANRMRAFEARANLNADTRVLDVGGTSRLWLHLSRHPNITILNLPPNSAPPGATVVAGDGTKLPFRDQSFDIVFCNSVIEHVGSADKQTAFAKEIMRVGRSFYVQTPNRWFPLEPHLLTPLIHFLPSTWRRRLLRNWTVWGIFARPTQQAVDEFVDATRLLDASEMRRLFPTAQLERERVLGLTKSLIASRGLS